MSRKIVHFIVIAVCLMAIISGCSSKKTTEASNRCATPVLNPGGDTYTSVQSITVTCATADAAIYYTTNGSTPTETSTLYTDPIQILVTTTVKAKAFKDDLTASNVATATYTIDLSNMIHVPGGTYNNGTSDVTVSTFYISKYELTQADYEAVMGINPSQFNTVVNGPVDQATWFNAVEYCNKRSMNESLTPCYSYGNNGTNPANWPAGWNTANGNHTNISCNWSADGYRLPSEGEWYFAARGGNLTHDYNYSGSSNIDDVGWYSGNALSTTHSVGLKAPNELGLYDMTGNVSEWVWDIYAALPSTSQNNPHGPTTGADRTIRGGNLTTNAYYCSLVYRYYYPATTSSSHIGFRVCRHSL